MRRGRHGFWMRFAVVVLEPLLTVLTRRAWRGLERIPRSGGVVLVTNHISHLDPLTFAHFVYAAGRLPRFLAKEELFAVPFVGAVLRGAEQIPVAREREGARSAYDAAVAAVRSGEAVCIYPEATLTRDPQLWPMAGKTGAVRVALETGAPVVPVAQWGVHRLLPPYARRPRLCWRPLVSVHAGPPVALDDLRQRPIDAATLQLAADRITDAVAGLLAQIRGEPMPAHRFDPRTSPLPRIGAPRPSRALRRGRRGSR